MVFHRFDRQVLAKVESAEGTAESLGVGDFVEVLEDVTFTLTPFNVERPFARPAFTSIPDYYASTGITSSDTVVIMSEMTFTVELAADSTGPTSAAPGYDALLKACGFDQIATVKYETISGGTVTGGPFFNREQCTATSNFRTVSTIFDGDTTFYYTGTDPATTSVTGDVSSASATITNTATAAGIAYVLDTDSGIGNSSSATIQLWIDGRTITTKGNRGNVVFNFNAMDRVLMTFTMTGIVHEITNGSATTGVTYGHALPPTFTGATLKLMEATGTTDFTNALFSTMTLDLGNDVVLREDANSGNGWKAGQITDRNPTLTMNPDAIVGGATAGDVFDFFDKWAQGTECRANWRVGTLFGGNAFHFKAPFLQWSGVADGDRDNFTIYDCSAKLTGGYVGDSVDHGGSGTTQLYADKGAENELVIIMS